MRRCLLLLGLLLATSAGAQSIIRSDFDHDTTTFRLQGSHAVAQCADCHGRGVFSGTPQTCNGCHTTVGQVRASAKPAFHILSSNTCESCHTEFAWIPVQRVDHEEVLGTCESCHNNRVAVGKPLNHIPTTADCDVCHRTSVFALAVFSHDGIVAGCVGCHNNRIVAGKPADHIPAPDTCEDCHNVTSWSFTTFRPGNQAKRRPLDAEQLVADGPFALPSAGGTTRRVER
ncbi:MAG: cytochrome c3 family protein [Pseudomonadota bacterium]